MPADFIKEIASLRLPPSVLRPLGEIDRFCCTWQVRPLLKRERLTVLDSQTRSDATGAALRFDGIRPVTERIAENDAERDITLHAARYDAAFKTYSFFLDMSIAATPLRIVSDTHIRGLHEILCEGSRSVEEHLGRYRTGRLRSLPGSMLADVPGISADSVSASRKELMEWYLTEVEVECDHHPLFVIAVFNARFLEISPFQSGNGRVAMALTRELLTLAGYGFAGLADLEHLLQQFRFPGLVSRETGAWTIDRPRLFGSLLRGVEFAIHRLNRQAEADRNAPEELPELSRRILDALQHTQQITCAEAVNQTGANRNTVKLHLTNLVGRGLLRRHGAGRSTWSTRA